MDPAKLAPAYQPGAIHSTTASTSNTIANRKALTLNLTSWLIRGDAAATPRSRDIAK
jgi:hypothetical protein